MVTASESRRGGLLGRGGQPVDAWSPWLEFHPVLEVDGPGPDHVAARGEGGQRHVGVRRRSCRTRSSRLEPRRCSNAGRNDAAPARRPRTAFQVHRFGDGPRRGPPPSDRLGVRVGCPAHSQFFTVRLAVPGRVDADAPRWVPTADSTPGIPRGHVGDGLPAGQPDAGAPAPQVHAGGLDLGTGKADRLVEMSGQAESARCTRARARAGADAPTKGRRAGMCRAPSTCGIGAANRAEQRGRNEPSAGREHDHGRVNPIRRAAPARSAARRSTNSAAAVRSETARAATAHRLATPVVEPPVPPPGPRPPWWRARRRSPGTVPPRPAGRAAPGAGTGARLSMTTMGCRPTRRARRVCLRICQAEAASLPASSCLLVPSVESRFVRHAGSRMGQARPRRRRRGWRG